MIDLKEQIACVQREIAQRLSVYPRLVSKGKMTALRAKVETDRMRAVLKTLQDLDSMAPKRNDQACFPL